MLENACARKDRLIHVFVKDPSIENRTSCTRFKIFVCNKLKIFCNKPVKNAKSKYYQSYEKDHYKLAKIPLKCEINFVSVHGADSDRLELKHGVPQGGILVPLLFLIYKNDIPEIANFASFILYAYDANIVTRHE